MSDSLLVPLGVVRGRVIFAAVVESPSKFGNLQSFPNRHFILATLLAFTNEYVGPMSDFYARAFAAGAVYVCCWGPGCERAHDLADEEFVGDGSRDIENEPVIMTTWHTKDSLSDFLEFALVFATPDDPFIDSSDRVFLVYDPKLVSLESIKTALLEVSGA